MKLGPSAQRLAVIDALGGGQDVFKAPGHPDRVIVLDMFGQRGFALARDRLAQARHAEPGVNAVQKPTSLMNRSADFSPATRRLGTRRK